MDMTISVSGSSPRRFLIPGTRLYVLVKPQGLDYWLQPLPKVDSAGWTVKMPASVRHPIGGCISASAPS